MFAVKICNNGSMYYVNSSCLIYIICFCFVPSVAKESARLVNAYHPSLWVNRSYPCCGSGQRSTARATGGCRSVTWWSPDSMGINFSHIIHSSSAASSAAPASHIKPANGGGGGGGADIEAAKTTGATGEAAVVGDAPASPSASHNAIVTGTTSLPSH